MLPACVEHAARLFSALNEQAARSTMPGNAIQLPSAPVQHAASLCRTCGPLAVEHAARLFPLLNEQAARSTVPGNAIQLPSAAVEHAARLFRFERAGCTFYNARQCSSASLCGSRTCCPLVSAFERAGCTFYNVR